MTLGVLSNCPVLLLEKWEGQETLGLWTVGLEGPTCHKTVKTRLTHS